MTNLVVEVIAAISLITNRVPSDNAIWLSGSMAYPSGGNPIVLAQSATERYLTTTIIEHTELSIPLERGRINVTNDYCISSVTEIFRVTDSWQRVQTRTNDPNVMGTLLLLQGTNLVSTNLIVLPNRTESTLWIQNGDEWQPVK